MTVGGFIATNFANASFTAIWSRRKLPPASTTANCFEFLFLPGFSTREAVSTVSGRGVGLNVVQSMVQEAGGSVTVTSEPGAGTVFRLTLPVTRSVIKVIRLQVEGEFYAVPLVRIDRVAHLEPAITAASGHSNSRRKMGSLPMHPERCRRSNSTARRCPS
jgi:chemotaxis protein histidine kinase CheA